MIFPQILLELPTLGKDTLTCPLFCNKWALLLTTLHFMRRQLEQDSNPKGGDGVESQENRPWPCLWLCSPISSTCTLYTSVSSCIKQEEEPLRLLGVRDKGYVYRRHSV